MTVSVPLRAVEEARLQIKALRIGTVFNEDTVTAAVKATGLASLLVPDAVEMVLDDLERSRLVRKVDRGDLPPAYVRGWEP